MHHAKQIAGNIPIQVMSEHQIAIGIVNPRTVRGDHVRLDPQVIADLPDIHVVAARRKNEVHSALGEQLQRFFRVRGECMVGGEQCAV